MKFSEKLIRLRKIKGMTQDELASAVGVSRQAVYKWESGQSYPEVLKLIELKRLFEISIDDLLDESFEIPLPEKKKRKRSEKKQTETTVERLTPPEAAEEEIKFVAAAEIAEEKEKESVPGSATVREADAVTEKEEEAPEIKSEKTEEKESAASAASSPEKKVGFFGRLFGRR